MFLSVLKGFGDVWNRVFDHRPFLNGEIKFFLKEFEERRKDREVVRLFESLELVTDIRDSQIPKASAAFSALYKVNALVEAALQSSLTILDSETDFDPAQALSNKRDMRKAVWGVFQSEMDLKFKAIDDKFEQKEKELKEFYEKL